MLKNLELRNQRIVEDVDFLIKNKAKMFWQAVETVAFKYGLENETVEKVYRKVERANATNKK